MRIIKGKHKGYQFRTYAGENTRPTTDLAKESLFNSLDNITDIEDKYVLDLFAGTGNIGLEFLSRGAAYLTSADISFANITFMKKIQKELDIKEWTIIKSDALRFLKKFEGPADILFADPPYNYVQLHQLVSEVTKAEWFIQNKTIFILEHSDKMVFDEQFLFLKKQYGSTCFSFFRS
jgi:16S rRNA (guanine(966)-N(2))-methyltransferase RsmD